MDLDWSTLERLALDLIKTNNVSFARETPSEPYGVYTVSGPDGARLMTVEYGGFYNKFFDARIRRNYRLGVITIAPDDPDCQYVVDSGSDIERAPMVHRVIEACIYWSATRNRINRTIDFLKSNIR